VDVVIVGAGPAGCRTAEIIAKKGYEVLVLEEHQEIGKPVQCTGLVSKRIGKIPKKIILNKIKRARFYSQDEYFEIKSRKRMLLLDRRSYDSFLAERAKKAGTRIQLSTRFLGFENNTVLTNHGKVETKFLIGADGPNSAVARSVKIRMPDNLLFAMQVNVKSRFDSNTVELHFGSEVAPGSFAWVVPENEKIARVGLMTTRNPNKYLSKFLKHRFGKMEAFNSTGDIIRYGLIEESVADKVLLVGDAACQIKPFSAGGLVYNKIGAEIAGNAVVAALEQNDFSKKFLRENYDRRWKEELAWPIMQGLFFKWSFSKISDIPSVFALLRILNLGYLANFLDIDFLQK
jgi:geranylgeranyl reductase family protein